jgi:hypothetical protein
MGNVTLIRVHNDATNEIENNQKEFVEEIIHALNRGQGSEYDVGHHCNAVKIFPSVHSHDSSLYLLYGGELIEMNPNSEETMRLLEKNGGYVKECVELIKQKIGKLEALLPEHKEEFGEYPTKNADEEGTFDEFSEYD